MNKSQVYIFSEALNSADTLHELAKSAKPIPVQDARRWTRLIILAVNDLHKAGIAHLNLRSRAILFDMKGALKLAGFCRSTCFHCPTSNTERLQAKEKRSKRHNFLPPEVFAAPYMPSKVDVWSVGVLVVFMNTKLYPFSCSETKTKFANQWRNFVSRQPMHKLIASLCKVIFTTEPCERPSFEELLAHPYFKADVESLKKVEPIKRVAVVESEDCDCDTESSKY